MITGRMDTGASVLLDGYTYHALNGWGLFFELGMMTLPPVPMMAGPFGIFGFWPWLFIVSFIAHVVFGVILGVLAHRCVRDEGTILAMIRHDDVLLHHDLRHRPA